MAQVLTLQTYPGWGWGSGNTCHMAYSTPQVRFVPKTIWLCSQAIGTPVLRTLRYPIVVNVADEAIS